MHTGNREKKPLGSAAGLAARAGESGRGFAGEIRKLAEPSGKQALKAIGRASEIAGQAKGPPRQVLGDGKAA